jgi:hypothetical protein
MHTMCYLPSVDPIAPYDQVIISYVFLDILQYYLIEFYSEFSRVVICVKHIDHTIEN